MTTISNQRLIRTVKETTQTSCPCRSTSSKQSTRPKSTVRCERGTSRTRSAIQLIMDTEPISRRRNMQRQISRSPHSWRWIQIMTIEKSQRSTERGMIGPAATLRNRSITRWWAMTSRPSSREWTIRWKRHRKSAQTKLVSIRPLVRKGRGRGL